VLGRKKVFCSIEKETNMKVLFVETYVDETEDRDMQEECYWWEFPGNELALAFWAEALADIGIFPSASDIEKNGPGTIIRAQGDVLDYVPYINRWKGWDSCQILLQSDLNQPGVKCPCKDRPLCTPWQPDIIPESTPEPTIVDESELYTGWIKRAWGGLCFPISPGTESEKAKPE
jgi:hypothetical protein